MMVYVASFLVFAGFLLSVGLIGGYALVAILSGMGLGTPEEISTELAENI